MPNSDHDEILRKTGELFTAKVREHGTTPQGADWNSEYAQTTRFAQITKVCPPSGRFSILDYGCGYGALADFLRDQGAQFTYTGYDVSSEMVQAAREAHAGMAYAFTDDGSALEPADYVVESGIFNRMMAFGRERWERYIRDTLDRMNELSERGFAFNMLTKYSDADRMAERPDLYFADPEKYFAWCKTRYARNVALLHDYEIYEFTILVRKITT